MHVRKLIWRIRVVLVLFMLGLIASGVTAFPLQWELGILTRLVAAFHVEHSWPALAHWILLVDLGLRETYARYPFIAYGTDWLAFAHIVIAVSFIGPLRDPVRNIWVVEFGMIACVLVIPLACIMGPLRGIPFYWQLIDCSFGVVGFIPLWLVRHYILRLAELQAMADGLV